MENAAKALLMAGGILVTILILTLLAYTYTTFSEDASDIYKQLSETEITDFNQQFLNYDGKDLTIQDVVTIINIARDNNESQQRPVTVEVYIDNEKVEGGDNVKADVNEYLKDDLKEQHKYKCTGISQDTTSRLVNRVDIIKIIP